MEIENAKDHPETAMPRFVVLEHDHPFLHWDLMLEAAGALRTWRLADPPTGPVSAEPLPDHRVEYLDYEGPVSGDRGQVRRWDAGMYEMVEQSSQAPRLIFHGQRLKGSWKMLDLRFSPEN
jgi:hypothetical protein